MNLGYNYSPITHSSKVYVKGKYNEGNFQVHPLCMPDVLTRGCSVGTNCIVHLEGGVHKCENTT